MRLVVLSDLNPVKFPGAASVAYDLALEAAQEYDVEFWFADSEDAQFPESQDLQTRIRKIAESHLRRMDGNLLRRFYFELLGFKELYWLFRQIKEFHPTHVWIHQIGSRFPKSIILLLKLLKIPVILTIHDFGIIFNRKLFPGDMDFFEDHNSISLIDKIKGGFHLRAQKKEHKLFLNLRRKLVLFLYSYVDKVICISELEAYILLKTGLKINEVIPNGTRKCDACYCCG